MLNRSTAAALARPFHFLRTHLPTGTVTTGDFNGTHDMCWGGDQWKHTPLATLERSATALVRGWNSARPENTMWRYSMASGPAPIAS